MPKVSIVMASYNHEGFVAQSIMSVLGQSYGDFEFIITDDGSKDRTVQVIESFDDDRIKFRAFQANRGACVALNDAISRSRGEYVSVLNSDDYYLPDKIARQVDFLSQNKSIGAVFGLPRFVDERGIDIPRHVNPFRGLFYAENCSRAAWLRRFFYHGNCLCHPSVMVRRECYEYIGMLDPTLMQLPDFDLWVRFCRKYEIVVQPEEVTVFRVLDRERNTSAPSSAASARTAWELSQVLRNYSEMSDAELKAIFPEFDAESDGKSIRVWLALQAIGKGQPGFVQFGLELLRSCIRNDCDSDFHVEYFRLVGSLDPYGTQYSTRMYRILRNSRFVACVRAAFGRMRRFKEYAKRP